MKKECRILAHEIKVQAFYSVDFYDILPAHELYLTT